jgi:hypothetical protein
MALTRWMERVMRTLYAALAVLILGLGATAQAQLPFPFGPEPDFSERWQCSKDYVRSVQRQLEVMEKLRSAGPEAVGRICTLIEMGSAWLGGELPDAMRQELRSLLGVDVDLERVKAQCRVGQDSLKRELAARLAQMKAELARCDDTV